MKLRHHIWLTAAGVLLPSLTGTALADVKTDISVAELFGEAKPGTWVRLEGVPQADQTIRCTKARLITGAIEADDWAIKGQLRSVEPGSRQLTVGRHRVKLNGAPKFSNPAKTLKSISDLRLGMYVKVEGTYGPDGFVARKVEDQSADAAEKVGAEKKVLHQGKIERVDSARRAIILMGSTFVLSPDTQATSVVEM